jgi:hypothetical protein
MSDRIKGFVVTLEKDIRDDDADEVKRAIAMIKGVASVDSSVANADDHINRMQIRTEIANNIFSALYPKR